MRTETPEELRKKAKIMHLLARSYEILARKMELENWAQEYGSALTKAEAEGGLRAALEVTFKNAATYQAVREEDEMLTKEFEQVQSEVEELKYAPL